jgi:hypothetical protein
LKRLNATIAYDGDGRGIGGRCRTKEESDLEEDEKRE